MDREDTCEREKLLAGGKGEACMIPSYAKAKKSLLLSLNERERIC